MDKEPKIGDKTPQKSIESKTADTTTTPNKKFWPVGIVIGAIVLAFLSFGVGWISRIGVERVRNIVGTPMMQHGYYGGPRAGLVNPTSGNTSTRLSGVVTQVNGNTFTIAGNGTTKTITTDSNTSYSVSTNKVNVNDSVIVFGTDSNGTFTATSVRVLNL